MQVTILGFSQPMTVTTTDYTVPQLVNNVLINSPCMLASNITWRTGTNFSSTNGIGFFQNTNPNFPMQSGVVLSTGNALESPGPNTSILNTGATTWPGDTALETTLAASGISLVSKNATILEFDFTPISPTFSFDFIFASEEYGNFQCQFSDAFAFLLTNMNTGITTNLAVVPNTTAPISVVTIRDFLYNSSCSSANPQYFGSFNGGSSAANAAINFNGQTIVMTAASVLTSGVPYHIKLVIADRVDPQSDSAIFISSDSFNIGQDVLGSDMTSINNTAVCFGATHTLNTGLTAANYTFSWTRNGVVLPSETTPTLIINQAGTYSVTYTHNNGICQPITDTIIVEYRPQITSPNPTNLSSCDTGATTYTYNLNANTSRVKQGLSPLTIVTYHAFQNDANNNINPLPLLYNSASGQTIYVRIQLPNGCFRVKSFQLLLSPSPTATQPQNMIKCARSLTQNNAYFNLTSQNSTILNGQSSLIYTVKYYTSLNDATNNTNSISNANNFLSSSRTIYVRLFNTTDLGCFSLTSFNLIVNPKPLIDQLGNVLVCSSYTLRPLVNGNYFTATNGGGTPLFAGYVVTSTRNIYIYNQPGGPGTCDSNSMFTVTIVNSSNLTPEDVTNCGSYTLPALDYGKYYTGPNASGTVIPAGTVISSSQMVYYYFTTTIAPICIVASSFTVTILPTIEVENKEDVFECSSYTLPNLSLGNYFTGAGGTGSQLVPGSQITLTQTIYIYAATTGTSTPCSDEDSFNVYIGLPQPENISQCNGYTLPYLSIGNYFTGPTGTGQQIPAGTVINTSSTIYIYAQTASGGPNCTDNLHFTLSISQPPIDLLNNVSACESYTLPSLTNGEYYTATNGTGTMLHPGDLILSTQTIYIFNRLNSSCFSQSNFTVTIHLLPAISSRSDIDICDQYVLTPLQAGNYFTGPNGTGTLLTAGTGITTSQRIYIYAISNTTPACSIQNSFQINIYSTSADVIANVTACDSFTLTPLTADNKYFTQSGGPTGTGTEILPGTAITTSQNIYIFKESLIRTAFSCVDETSFTVTISNTPTIPAVADVFYCDSYTLQPLTVGNYYTGADGTGTLLQAGDIITNNQTLYVFANTNTSPDCKSEISFQINIFSTTADVMVDVTACDSFTLPTLTAENKYFTQSGGPTGTGTEVLPGTVITTSQIIYIFKESLIRTAFSCTDETSFTVTINNTPTIQAVADVFYCDSYTLQPLTIGNYYTGADGTGTLLQAGDVITNNQSLYVFSNTNTSPACSTQNSFQINIFSTTADVMANVTTCDSFTLPALTADNKYFTQSGGPTGTGTEILPGTVITTSQIIYIFKESLLRTTFSCVDETSFTVTINNTQAIPVLADVFYCGSYTLQPLTIGNYYTGADGTGAMLTAGTVITTSQRIYIYAVSNTTPACTMQNSFNISLINVETLPNVITCGSYTLPNLTTGQYFTGPNGTGLLLNVGSTISTSQTIYIYAESSNLPRCFDESSFTVTIIDTPVAHTVPAALSTICDEDGTNDGVTSFNLASLSSTVLGTQTGSEFTIAYYETMANATNQSNAITTTTLATVYVRVNNTLTPNCFDIKPISITIITLPEPTPADGILCFDSETQTLLNAFVIHSGLNSAAHTFVWSNEEGTTVGTGSNYTAVLPGIYTLVATRTGTGCSSAPVSVTIITSEPAVVTYIVEEEFSDSQSIIVTATGQGNNFEYQLDNGPFQDSPVFSNVLSGLHTITVRDKNGCGSTTIQAVVINYPKYFTPNGDGYHDTWNITNLSNQPSAHITIYDRYGKVITQIRPNGNGWDGTYNGNMIPSDDYWFSVSYTSEDKEVHEFRSHFAMKR